MRTQVLLGRYLHAYLWSVCWSRVRAPRSQDLAVKAPNPEIIRFEDFNKKMTGLAEGAQIPRSNRGGAEPGNHSIWQDFNKKMKSLGEGAQIPRSGRGDTEPGNHPIWYNFNKKIMRLKEGAQIPKSRLGAAEPGNHPISSVSASSFMCKMLSL